MPTAAGSRFLPPMWIGWGVVSCFGGGCCPSWNEIANIVYIFGRIVFLLKTLVIWKKYFVGIGIDPWVALILCASYFTRLFRHPIPIILSCDQFLWNILMHAMENIYGNQSVDEDKPNNTCALLKQLKPRLNPHWISQNYWNANLMESIRAARPDNACCHQEEGMVNTESHGDTNLIGRNFDRVWGELRIFRT